TRAGVKLDRLLGGRVVGATLAVAATGGPGSSETLRDFDNFRQAMSGPGVHALLDLPWTPIYLFVLFLLHPLLGSLALASALLLVAVAMMGQVMLQGPVAGASQAGTRNYTFTEMSLRNAEVVEAMGMLPGLIGRWNRDRRRHIGQQMIASDRAA